MRVRARVGPVLALLAAALAGGCNARPASPAAQLITLYDLVSAASSGGTVAATSTFPAGFPATKFITPVGDGTDQLNAGRGFVDSQPAWWVTTELWLDFDEVWAQPLYRATQNGVVIDSAQAEAPWVFSIGPRSLFYSPFWNEFGFELPAGVDVNTVLDTRAVIELANSNGGFRALGRRITSLAPHSVVASPQYPQGTYIDDTATWYGSANHRFVDFGEGGFDADASAVVTETPFFVFASRDENGTFQSLGLPWVGGTGALFSGTPSLVIPAAGSGSSGSGSGASGGGGSGSSTTPVTVRPSSGGLWRIYWVVPFSPIPGSDGRLTDCLPTGQCLTLDAQSAIEALGADRIFRSEILTATPLLQLGDVTFSAQAMYSMGEDEQ